MDYKHTKKQQLIAVFSFTLLFMHIQPPAYAPSVGILPSVVDLGDVSRGESKLVDMYLATNSQKDLYFKMGYTAPFTSYYFRQYVSEYSEEDISKWLEFPEKTVWVNPKESFIVTLDGTDTKVNKKAQAVLNIPKNAEPGYHVGSVSFNPVTSPSIGAAEVSMFGMVRPIFIFKVAGSIKREGMISRIEAERTGKNSARINIYFRNTGTNTISTNIEKSFLKIYNNLNEIRAEKTIGSGTISPGEEYVVSVDWTSGEGIKDGQYRVDATINYWSGNSFMSQKVTVPSIISTAPAGANIQIKADNAILSPSNCYIDIMLLISIALVAGLAVYWLRPREDIKTIAAVAGMSFLGSYIVSYLTCGSILLSALMAVLVVFYIINKK